MKKRALTLLLALVMCLSLCTPALASTPHYLETDWSKALSSGVPLSTVVELITEKYLLPQTEGLNSVTTNNGTAASDIVKLCRPVETQSIGGWLARNSKWTISRITTPSAINFAAFLN